MIENATLNLPGHYEFENYCAQHQSENEYVANNGGSNFFTIINPHNPDDLSGLPAIRCDYNGPHLAGIGPKVNLRAPGLLKLAEASSAGLIKYFFDEVNFSSEYYPPVSPQELTYTEINIDRIKLQWRNTSQATRVTRYSGGVPLNIL